MRDDWEPSWPVALCIWALLILCLWSSGATAQEQYRRDLTRSARLVWGLDAPVATVAAQIHQESGS